MTFLEEIQQWLSAPAGERDLEKVALMMLQCNRNRIMYNNVMRRPAYYAKQIEYQLQKYLKKRTASITHEEVAAMERKADEIMAKHTPLEPNPAKEFRRGKRIDHDSLPQEIQSLYTENFAIIRRMRECHLQARNASGPNQACIDGDKYPFLKELIELDKQLHDNWRRYDEYKIGGDSAGSNESGENSTKNVEISSQDDKKYIQLTKMAAGKYRKNPNEPQKVYIRDLYGKIAEPPKQLTVTLTELGILDEKGV